MAIIILGGSMAKANRSLYLGYFAAIAILGLASPVEGSPVLRDTDILGRWYSDREIKKSEEDGSKTSVRLCSTDEYFKNGMTNFGGEAIFRISDDTLRFTISYTLRGTYEWSWDGESIMTKLHDIKFLKNYVRLDSATGAEDRDVREKFERLLDTLLPSLFPRGYTSSQKVVSFDGTKLGLEELDDDGDTERWEALRSKVIKESCD